MLLSSLPVLVVLLGALAAVSKYRSFVVPAALSLAGAAVLAAPEHETALWHFDHLARVCALSTLVVTLVVTIFALRQFEGEPRQRYVALFMLTGAEVLSLDASASRFMLLISWVAVSITTYATLACLAPCAKQALMLTRRWLLLSDIALVFAFTTDTHNLATPLSAPPALAPLTLIALLVATFVRAGMTPRSWVPATIAAPTPASALLHAGVVSAGLVLLLRLGVYSCAPMWLLAAALLYCVALIVHNAPRITHTPVLKAQLATSTISQMAFMFATWALGYPVLALTHAIGHGLYKAIRFMSAGGAVAVPAPAPRRKSPLATRFIGILSLVALLTGCYLTYAESAVVTLYGLAAITMWNFLSAHSVRHPVRTFLALTCVLLGYFAIVGSVSSYLDLGGSCAAFFAPALVALAAALPRPPAPRAVSLAPAKKLAFVQ